MVQPITYLVYASAAAPNFDKSELGRILASSRRNNNAADLTGMLLFAEGSFMQALEGPAPAVRETFERISRDPRHRSVQILYEGKTDARQFPDWRMGYRLLRKDNLPPGLVDLRAEALSKLPDLDQVVRTLFGQFYDSVYRYERA